MIQNVLSQINLEAKDLEFTCLAKGPGSFTGLRLGFATLKALETANGTKIYGVPTLEALAQNFLFWNEILITCLDAKRNRFYVNIYDNGKILHGPLDIDDKEILEKFDIEKKILLVGSGANLLKDKLKKNHSNLWIECLPVASNNGFSLINLAKKMNDNGIKPLESYEGPYYIRDEHGNVPSIKE